MGLLKPNRDVGIIGYGYWGPNLARNFHQLPGAWLVAGFASSTLAPSSFVGVLLHGQRQLVRLLPNLQFVKILHIDDGFCIALLRPHRHLARAVSC